MNDTAQPQQRTGPFEIPTLDGLRAVSFMMVFLGHVGLPVPGGFGVTVFFFLSGYLITTLMRREVDRIGGVDLKLFYARRALRILPPFYLILFGAVILTETGALAGELELPSVLAQALHYSNYWLAFHGWDGIAPGTGVYWSLAVEEHFYLLFPALYGWMIRSRLTGTQQRNVLWGICAAVLVWRIVLIVFLGANSDRTYLTTDGRADSMLFGCALAVAGNPMLDDVPLRHSERRAMGALAVGLLALLGTFVYRNEVFRSTLRYSIQGMALYPVFVTGILFPQWLPFRLLNLRFVRFVGTLSYSLYLVHQVILFLVEGHVGGPHYFKAAFALIAAGLTSTAIWYTIEEPCARVRKRLSARRRVQVAV